MQGVLEGIMNEYGISWEAPCTVYVGRDTRPHSGSSLHAAMRLTGNR
jgi:hypothetical protein